MGLTGGQIADLCVFVFCVLAYIIYHLWYFVLRSKLFLSYGASEHINLWKIKLKTRQIWSESTFILSIVLPPLPCRNTENKTLTTSTPAVMMNDGKEGINAVQTMRNMIITVSLLAAAEVTLVAQLLNILTDAARIQQLEVFGEADPISGGSFIMSPQVKVSLALGSLFASFLVFAQCVRIAVYLGYLIRVVPSNPSINLPLKDDTVILMQRASLYFTIGLRLLYMFVPLSFYMTLGTLALLITTLVLLVALFLLDEEPGRHMTSKRDMHLISHDASNSV